jgi:hypothetical protein
VLLVPFCGYSYPRDSALICGLDSVKALQNILGR